MVYFEVGKGGAPAVALRFMGVRYERQHGGKLATRRSARLSGALRRAQCQRGAERSGTPFLFSVYDAHGLLSTIGFLNLCFPPSAWLALQCMALDRWWRWQSLPRCHAAHAGEHVWFLQSGGSG